MQLGVIMLPFLLLAVLAYFSVNKELAAGFTPVELEMYRYTIGTVLSDSQIKTRPRLNISPDVSGPLYIAGRGAPETARPAAEAYTVSFILITETQRTAVINNAIVKEGDILDDRKVSRIEKDRVALTMNGKTTWLKMEAQ
jgi:hypothetical protein